MGAEPDEEPARKSFAPELICHELLHLVVHRYTAKRQMENEDRNPD